MAQKDNLLKRINSAIQVIKGTDNELNIIQNAINSAGNNTPFDIQNPEVISTVYTCIKILGETVGRLPIRVLRMDANKGKVKQIDHNLYNLLHYKPNNYTNSNTFFTTLEVWRNLRGNSYARIYRDFNGFVTSLEIINPDHVKGYVIVNNNLYYKVFNKLTKKYDTINADEILHFKMISKDGIMGLNPIEAIRLNASSTWEALGTIDNYYKENGVNPKAIKSTVSGANQKAMLEALDKYSSLYAGKKRAGAILPLPPNTELQELNMNAIDAAFLSMLGYNDAKISAIYGVPAYLIGDNSNSKYSNIEQTQLSFKTNTVASIARMYRQELEIKLLPTYELNQGFSIEFNLMALVETDHKSRIEGYGKLANIGVLTPNQIAILEGFETYEGGKDHYIQTNMQSVERYNAKPV